MTIKISTGARNALLATMGFSSLFANGVIEIRSGSQPVSADAAATGTLLGVVTVNAGAFTPGDPTNGLNFGTPVSGSVSKNTDVWRFEGVAAGTAGWFRLKGNALDDNLASTTLARMDGSIASLGGDMNLSSLSIAVGAPTTIDAFSLTMPGQ